MKMRKILWLLTTLIFAANVAAATAAKTSNTKPQKAGNPKQSQSTKTSASQPSKDISFGVRVGYSIQSADGGKLYKIISPLTDVNMGLLGIGADAIVNIPVGPIVIAPEVGFLYRTVANIETTIPGLGTEKEKMSEFAVSIPIMVKWFPIQALYITAGFQIDVPIASETCDDKGKNCEKLDGKTVTKIDTISAGWPPYVPPRTQEYQEKHPERASVDIGIPMGIGYMITPNLGVDFRFVLGLNNLVKYEEGLGLIKVTLESGSMNTFGLGVSYYF